jgi:hypothetical protein
VICYYYLSYDCSSTFMWTYLYLVLFLWMVMLIFNVCDLAVKLCQTPCIAKKFILMVIAYRVASKTTHPLPPSSRPVPVIRPMACGRAKVCALHT